MNKHHAKSLDPEARPKLRSHYDFDCCVCGKALKANPSLLMGLGINSGCGTCTSCGTFLHLTVDPDLSGERMVSEIYEVWHSRTTGQATEAAG